MALLKWYDANKVPTTFLVGQQPYGLAFDGENLWVANNASQSVTKLRASDGTLLGTFQVGGAPYGVTFDGANVWVSNLAGANVSKLRASDGKLLGTFNKVFRAHGSERIRICRHRGTVGRVKQRHGDILHLRL